MLEFNSHQLSAFAEGFHNCFVLRTVTFLKLSRPAWSATKADVEIAKHLQHVVCFARVHNVKTAASLQKLALMEIDMPFNDELDSYARMLLRAKGWSEERRIANFDAARQSNQSLRQLIFKT